MDFSFSYLFLALFLGLGALAVFDLIGFALSVSGARWVFGPRRRFRTLFKDKSVRHAGLGLLLIVAVYLLMVTAVSPFL